MANWCLAAADPARAVEDRKGLLTRTPAPPGPAVALAGVANLKGAESPLARGPMSASTGPSTTKTSLR